MTWRIEFLSAAARELDRVDRPDRQRILGFLRNRLAPREDPRSLGEALRGPEPGKYWKYRVGHYRIICAIRDDRILILVVRIGRPPDVYR